MTDRRCLFAAASLAVLAVAAAGCTGISGSTAPAETVPMRSPAAASSAPRPTPAATSLVPSTTTTARLPPAGPVAVARNPARVVWSQLDLAGPVIVSHATLVAGTNAGTHQSGVGDWDARTGRLRWRQFDPTAFPLQTVATASTVTTILGSPDTHSIARVTEPRVIHTFDLATGRLLWSRPVPQNRGFGGPNAGVAVTGASVVIAEGRSSVAAVDPRTGRTRWSSPGRGPCSMTATGTPDRDYPGPLVADAMTTVIGRDCGPTAVDALDSASGATRWSWPARGSGLTVTRGADVEGIADRVVFVAATVTGLPMGTEVASVLDRHGIASTTLVALDATTGAVLWSEPGALVGTVVADGPRAACLMSSGGYECRDARTGRLLFTPTEFDPGVSVYGFAANAVIAFPVLYQVVPVRGGGVHLDTRNATTGRLLATHLLSGWTWTTSGNGYQPAVIAAGAGLVLLQRIDLDPLLPLVAYR